MVEKWVMPNHYMIPPLVKVRTEIGSLREGGKSPAWVEQFGIELDLFVWNIDSYVLNLRVDWGCMGGF